MDYNNEYYNYTSPRTFSTGCLNAITLIIGIVIGIVIIAVVFIIGLFSTPDDVESTGERCIKMVQSYEPFNNGNTYYDAFENAFDSSEWSYFEEGNKRIVQVVSGYDDIDDKIVTQFLIRPDDNGNDFLTEPYAMSASGINLSSVERDIVMASLFRGDVLDALQRLFFYGALFG